jgi:hypothetical protein
MIFVLTGRSLKDFTIIRQFPAACPRRAQTWILAHGFTAGRRRETRRLFFGTLDTGTGLARTLSAAGNLFQDYPAFPFRKPQGLAAPPSLKLSFRKAFCQRTYKGFHFSNPVYIGAFSPFLPLFKGKFKDITSWYIVLSST